MREIKISQTTANQRLDKFLLKYLNKAPKSFIYKMIRKKNIKLNDKKADGSEVLAEGDMVKLFLSDLALDEFMEVKKINKSAGEIDIIYEDENMLACNKPVGLLSHPENSVDRDTLIDRILAYLEKKGEFDTSKESIFTPAIVNRLDRNTTGVVICGKDLPTTQWLNKEFAEKSVDKYYKTVVVGEIKKSGTLMGYHTKNRVTNEVKILKTPIDGGKQVITHYKPLKWGWSLPLSTTRPCNQRNGYTLLEIKLETGKSHQIRASFEEMGHCIIGDHKYGDMATNTMFLRRFKLKNQLLHCERILLKKQGSVIEIKAQLPKIFMEIEKEIFK